MRGMGRILAETGMKATFVAIPSDLKAHARLYRDLAAQGHEVAVFERRAAVAEAMKLLPDEQRTAIVLKEYHGLTFQEIAELQGCPLSTVKTRLYQGLSVLRQHLESQGVTSFASGRAS